MSFSRSSTDTHVERRADVVAAAKAVIAETGRVDFVVNTAGVLPRGQLAETSEETIYQATDVNYLAPIHIAQEFYPHLNATRGSLLLFTSSSYTRGRSGYSLYSSAKAAVVNLTQALADEWAGDGVRVNCVNPERTDTPMRTKAFGEEPPGTLLSSVEVARQSLDVLLSGQTGHVIDIRRAQGPAALTN
jgi:2-C-methyl-D-erythritol 4-phosphate cytidylyltransferase